MKKKNKKTFIIFLVGSIIGIIGFTISFIMYQKDEDVAIEPKEEVVFGDLVFSSIDESVYLDNAIPTLDKFGVMNKSFTFSIKNIGSQEEQYLVQLTDDNSTIKNSSIRYELTKNNQVIGIFTLSEDGVLDRGTISNDEIISYGIKLWIDYNSEVKVGRLSKRVTIATEEKEENDISKPILSPGMIPVYYDNNTNSWYKSNTENSYNSEWYNYEKKNWANAVTVNSDKRDYYQNSSVGTKINMEDVNAMFVWIPRFTYELKMDEINIRFINTNEKAYRAFTFNEKEISGFWITKFESTIDENSECMKSSLTKECNNSNNELYFIPNYPFYNRVTMANLFYSIRKMELKDNIYGFESNGTKVNNDGTIKGDNNNIDIHMIRNSEWQAVALLSNSKYGNEKNILNNNTNYSGKASIDNEVYDYNVLSNGTGASTTGNITGVYDMSGGKREFVMINNSNLNIFDKKANSGFTTSVKEYYYDNDFTDNDTTILFKNRYTDNSEITNEVITRGGYKNTGNIFNINSVNDYINKISVETNSRACLIISEEE